MTEIQIRLMRSTRMYRSNFNLSPNYPSIHTNLATPGYKYQFRITRNTNSSTSINAATSAQQQLFININPSTTDHKYQFNKSSSTTPDLQQTYRKNSS